MKESDWKVFRKIREQALAAICQDVLDRSDRIITNTDLSEHERYLDLYRLIQERDKEIGRWFDRFSRSQATIQLRAYRARGIADADLVARLSEELREITDPRS